MSIRVKSIFRLLKEAFKEWQQDKVSLLAAALAYYTMFSIAPLLVIAIAIASVVFGEEAARGEIVAQIDYFVGQQGAEAIETAIANTAEPKFGSTASIVSIVVLFIGASGVFAQLQTALNTVWNVQDRPNVGIWEFIRKRLLSFGMVVSIGFLLLVSLMISTVLTAINHFDINLFLDFVFFWRGLNILISFSLITLLFALIYKYLPDVRIRWKDVWVGAIITASLFVLGKYLISLYLGKSSLGSTYGAAGSLIVFLAWVFYSAQILLFGAELTQVYTRRYGSKIRPTST